MDWREECRDLGFVIVENVLSHSLIDKHLSDVSALVQHYGVVDAATQAALPMPFDDELMAAMLDLHRRSEVARGLMRNRVITALMRQLFGAPRSHVARSALWEPGNMKAHVDTAFRSPDPPYSICRAWCALEDIHPDSGRFYLVPGTHRTVTPQLSWEVLNERPDLHALFKRVTYEPQSWFRLHGRGWSYVSAKVADRVDPRAMLSFDLRKGDVVLFNPAMVYGTLQCMDPSLTRKMMVCEWAIEETATVETRRNSRRVAKREMCHDNIVDLSSVINARAATR